MMEEIMAVKKEVEDLKQESLAMEMIQDAKKQNKRLFIIWIITFIAFISLLGYTIYLLNDIGTIETTVQQDNNDGHNNYIGNDGDINNGKTNN